MGCIHKKEIQKSENWKRRATMSSPPAIVNLRMLFVCCILIAVKGGWDEEVGLLRRGGEQREFDYFKLALQWPGTYCRKTRHCCSSNACCTRYLYISLFLILLHSNLGKSIHLFFSLLENWVFHN